MEEISFVKQRAERSGGGRIGDAVGEVEDLEAGASPADQGKKHLLFVAAQAVNHAVGRDQRDGAKDALRQRLGADRDDQVARSLTDPHRPDLLPRLPASEQEGCVKDVDQQQRGRDAQRDADEFFSFRYIHMRF